MTTDAEQQVIDAFFTEFDRRVAERPDSRIVPWRPALEAVAAKDPEGFVRTIEEYFAKGEWLNEE